MEIEVCKWYKNENCSHFLISNVELKFNINFPIQYKNFMLWSNGGEGTIGNNYIVLWKIEDIVQYNLDYNIQKYLSKNIIGFGTDGGGICYAFDLHNNTIIKVPLGDLDINEIQKLSDSFDSFLGKSLYWNWGGNVSN